MTAAKFSSFSAKYHIVSSQYQCRELIKAGCKEERIVCIPNAVLLEDKRAKQKAENDRFCFGYAGHLFGIKGVDILIQAFARFQQKNRNVKLKLFSSGLGNKSAIKKMINKLDLRQNVELHIAAIDWDSIDCMVLPYRYSFGTLAFPQLLLESLGKGCPVITTNVRIIDEIITDKMTGLLAEPMNTVSLADKMNEIFSDPVLREEISERGKKLFSKVFDINVVSNSYKELLNKLTHISH